MSGSHEAFHEASDDTIWSKLRSPKLALTLIGATALSSLVAATAKATGQEVKTASAMSAIGFDSNFLLTNDPLEADLEAQAIENAHGNLARVYLRYTNGSAEVKNTLPQLCVAALAAYKHDLQLDIVTDGFFRRTIDPATHKKLKQPQFIPGYIPDKPAQKSRYISMVANMMWGLAGDKNPDGTGGCLPQQKNITISPITEFNYSGNPNSSASTRLAASFYSSIYTPLHGEAAKPGLDANLTIEFGDISTTSNNDPVGTLDELAKDLDGAPGGDSFNFHLYASKADLAANTATSALQTMDKVVTEVHTKFGADMPINITELGGNSPTTTRDEVQYSYKLPPGTTTFRGEGQARFYNQVIAHAACLGIKEVVIFHMTDDKADRWRSGLRLPLGQLKTGANSVASINYQALEGGSIDCPSSG